MLPSIVISSYKATPGYEKTAAPTCGNIKRKEESTDREKLEQLDNWCGKNGLCCSWCHWTSCFVVWCTPMTAVQLWGHVRKIDKIFLYPMLLFVVSLSLFVYMFSSGLDYGLARAAQIVAFGLSIITFLLVLRSRRTIREEWDTDEKPKKWGRDCCVVWCCNWCAICQMFALTRIKDKYVPGRGV